MIYGKHQILQGDVLDRLATLTDGSVQCCVTSPPYWGLRDYGVDGQVGLEPSPDAYVAKMVEVFREVRRVLRDDGTCWLNIGDSYNAYNGNRGPAAGLNKNVHEAMPTLPSGNGLSCKDLKPKDLCMIPWRVAIALQADGWWLRSVIVWAKKSPMPESVTDRPTSSWEPIFLMAKSERYFYDADAIKEKSVDRESIDGRRPRGQHAAQATGDKHFATRGGLDGDTLAGVAYPTRNCRNVWHLSPEYFREAHFATFPTEIPRRCILAGTSEKGRCPTCGNPWNRVVERSKVKRERPNDYTKRNGEEGTGNSCANSVAGVSSRTIGWEQGCKCEPHSPVPCVVLDPFSGSGTTGAVACQLGRNHIGIELNPEYVALSERRIGKALRPNAYADNGAAAIEDGLFA